MQESWTTHIHKPGVLLLEIYICGAAILRWHVHELLPAIACASRPLLILVWLRLPENSWNITLLRARQKYIFAACAAWKASSVLDLKLGSHLHLSYIAFFFWDIILCDGSCRTRLPYACRCCAWSTYRAAGACVKHVSLLTGGIEKTTMSRV